MATKPVGWEKVWEIYPINNFRKGAKIPCVLLLLSFCCYLLKGSVSEIHILRVMANLVSGGFPSVLGFVLTGYVLIVGFSGSEFLLSMAKKKTGVGHTLFERVNATFAVVIAILVLTYLMSVMVIYVLELQIVWPFDKGVRKFNCCVLLLFLFLMYYSLCALIDVIINIFNLGQFANVIAGKKLKAIEEIERMEEAEVNVAEEGLIKRLIQCLFRKLGDSE